MRRRVRDGFTLVEAAVLVCVVGVVLAVGVPTFLRAFRRSRSSEAVEMLGALAHAAESYYEKRWRRLGERRVSRCLPPAAGPTPETPTVDRVEVDFSAASVEGHETWEALGFDPRGGTRFSYKFEPVASGCDVVPQPSQHLYRARAYGDLDGDGELSTFERRTRFRDGRLVGASSLWVRDGVE
ncbi:MAG: hypothetical protein IT379_06785 [Deltaproteobacteria bacterium]|nr:hypothetical protein [Deltaproteobacteria bacterium]